ncbi:MAG: uracil-DNA glycosylase family protein, partial [Pseudomonadota bacterium]
MPSFGDINARLAIVGLAPGLQGANKTGRPFTGDYAGDLLYSTLAKFHLSQGLYAGHADDGLKLNDALITNAVRCVPPQNKPIGAEITQCLPFLKAQLHTMPRLQVIIALGRIAHESVVRAFDLKRSAFKFAHGAEHILTPPARAGE